MVKDLDKRLKLLTELRIALVQLQEGVYALEKIVKELTEEIRNKL